MVVVLELAQRPIPEVHPGFLLRQGDLEAPRSSGVVAGSVVAVVDSLLQGVEDTVEGDIDDEEAHTDVALDEVHHRVALQPAKSTNKHT